MLNKNSYDLIISGNGAIGCSFALYMSYLFRENPLSILMLEKQTQEHKFPIDFPSRNFALTRTNRLFLERMLSKDALHDFFKKSNKFRGMQIWQEDHNHHLQFGLEDTSNLGYYPLLQ